jgi:hypothetical protein
MEWYLGMRLNAYKQFPKVELFTQAMLFNVDSSLVIRSHFTARIYVSICFWKIWAKAEAKLFSWSLARYQLTDGKLNS